LGLIVVTTMIKEKEDRIEVAWLGAARYQWGQEGLL
jgi:hypothetical protein